MDVRASSVFWQKMELAETLTGQPRVPEWFSTHPSHENRAEHLDRLIPEVRWFGSFGVFKLSIIFHMSVPSFFELPRAVCIYRIDFAHSHTPNLIVIMSCFLSCQFSKTKIPSKYLLYIA